MILPLIGAALIGLSLGLLGSGGSILTVPVLVYLVGEPDKLAIAESLAIVGAISVFGAVRFTLKGQVEWRRVLLFGLPGMVGTALGAALSKNLPGSVQLTVFAAVMLLAAVMMFRPPARSAATDERRRPALLTALDGLAVGVLTGLVGVGGGFLIIPALVLLGGLPMGMAVGTSLAIITLNSFTGFYNHAQLLRGTPDHLNWSLILTFAAIGIVGSFVGSRIGGRVSNAGLRRGFAGFLVVMGLFVLGNTLPRVTQPDAQGQALRAVQPR